MAVTAPDVVVTAEGAGVVLELHQVHPATAEHDQVHLVPLALTIAKLEVRPGVEGWLVGQQLTDDPQALGLVGERRLRHLHPAAGQRHPSHPHRCLVLV